MGYGLLLGKCVRKSVRLTKILINTIMFGYTKYRRIILADSQAMYKTSTVIVFLHIKLASLVC